MVYTECAPKQQQFHVAPAMYLPDSAVSTPLCAVSTVTDSESRET